MHLEPGGRVFGRESVVELRQQPVGEADDAHRAVLQARPTHASMRAHRDHRRRFVVEHEA